MPTRGQTKSGVSTTVGLLSSSFPGVAAEAEEPLVDVVDCVWEDVGLDVPDVV